MIELIWIFIILALLCSTISRLMHRYVLRETEPYAYSLLTQLIAAALLLPLALTKFTLPTEPKAWIALAVAGALWTMVSVSTYITYKKAEVSVRDTVAQSKVLWVLLFGALFLREIVTTYRVVGTLVIFAGIGILLWHPERRFGKLTDPGVLWTLGNAFLAAVVAVVDKYALHWFPPEFYIFLVYLIPLFVLLAFLPGRTQHVRHLLKRHWFIAPLSIVLATAEYFFVIKAYSIADLTFVYPLLQMKTLLVVICGIAILGEREHFWQKILAAGIVVAGGILVGL